MKVSVDDDQRLIEWLKRSLQGLNWQKLKKIHNGSNDRNMGKSWRRVREKEGGKQRLNESLEKETKYMKEVREEVVNDIYTHNGNYSSQRPRFPQWPTPKFTPLFPWVACIVPRNLAKNNMFTFCPPLHPFQTCLHLLKLLLASCQQHHHWIYPATRARGTPPWLARRRRHKEGNIRMMK